MTYKILQRGAEAVIYADQKNKIVIKNRIKKSYRNIELDSKLRKQRTKSEKKLLEKAKSIINVPDVLPLNQEELTELKMRFIYGKKLSENLDNFSFKKQKEICRKIGESVASLHNNKIIHGDLTTSNMILVEDKNKPSSVAKKFSVDINKKYQSASVDKRQLRQGALDDFKIFFIDFGLGFISHKFEDKAVDIHLFKEALEARHFKNWKSLFGEFLNGYKKSADYEKVISQLKKVEARGRYKEQY